MRNWPKIGLDKPKNAARITTDEQRNPLPEKDLI